MSKERLEEIAENIKMHIDWASNTHYAEVTEKELKEYQQFILEQAERVQELEEELAKWQDYHKWDTIKLDNQNKHYRESINLALNHIHTGNFTLATIALNKALLKEVEQ